MFPESAVVPLEIEQIKDAQESFNLFGVFDITVKS